MSLYRDKVWNKPFPSRIAVEAVEGDALGTAGRYFCDYCLHCQLFEPKGPCSECGGLKWSLRWKIHVKVTEVHVGARESDSKQLSLGD